MKKQVISLIVPIFNTDIDLLNKCVNSVLNQSYKNIELILVNDGSKKELSLEYEKYKSLDNRIIYLYQDNKGITAARNKGIDIASGDYIMFVDSDDWIDETTLETMINRIIKDKSDVCMCGYKTYLQKGIEYRDWYKEDVTFNNEEIISELIEDKKINSRVPTKLFKKEIIKKIRFNERLKIWEDVVYSAETFRMCKKVSIVKERFYNYIYVQSSLSRSVSLEKSVLELEAWKWRYDFVKEYYPKFEDKAYSVYLNRIISLLNKTRKDINGNLVKYKEDISTPYSKKIAKEYFGVNKYMDYLFATKFYKLNYIRYVRYNAKKMLKKIKKKIQYFGK